MTILVIGSGGQLGRSLCELLAQSRQDFFATDRQSLDVTSQHEVNHCIDSMRPSLVVNASAYTAVDEAESKAAEAFAVNAKAPGAIAQACAQTGSRLIHISTDYVFDGCARDPYTERDQPNPTGVYGASKLAGEHAVLEACSDALVIRTAWVFSEYGRNFVKTMLRLADKPELRVVSDQKGCPTDAYSLAHAVLRASERRLTGIAHYTDGPATTWKQFADAIFDCAKAKGLVTDTPVVEPISTAEYPTAAARPRYSVLSNSRIDYAAEWIAGLNRVMDVLSADKAGLARHQSCR